MITQSPAPPLSFTLLPLVPGLVYGSQVVANGTNLNPVTANLLYALPFWVPNRVYLSQIGINITTNATGNLRVGIYRDSVGYPGALVSDVGTASSATTNGIRRIAPAALVQLIPGIYWAACVFSGTPGVSGDNTSGLPLLGFASNTSHSAPTGITVAFSYAALPNPFTAGGALTTGNFPRMSLQL